MFTVRRNKTCHRDKLPHAIIRPGLTVFLVLFAVANGFGAEDTTPRGERRPVHLLAVLIGGIDSDPSPAQIAGTAARSEGNSGLYRLAGDLQQERVIPEYFNWNGTRAGAIKSENPVGARGIAEIVRTHLQRFPGDRTAIVGNSWGGHTALEVARELRQGETPLALNLVVFLDASSTARGPARPKALPINANRAVNYFTHNAFVWGQWDAGKRLENIDLGDPARGYMVDGVPAYDSPLDLKAHVAAEWDERIHAEVKRGLLELVFGKGEDKR